MVNLNGNIPTLNFGLSIGILAIVGVGIVIGGLFIDETKKVALLAEQQSELAKKQSIQNNQDINYINSTLTDFIGDRNEAFNKTFSEFDNASIAQQIAAKERKSIQNNILGNLTEHRYVSNDTNARVNATLALQIEQEKQLIDLQNKTNTLIKSFNATNEEERGKAVDRIIESLAKDHEEIKGLLNNTDEND